MARKDSELCGKVRARIDSWDKAWNINREQFNEWMNFVMGEQWREDESKLFERYNKVPLTFNKLGALLNHLVGDQLQHTPQLQVEPDDNVPEETAEVRAALVKGISLDSNSLHVYQNAFGQSVVGGYGAFRVGLEYVDNNSFDQEIRLYSVKDPTRCYWDISAQNENKTDGLYAGCRTRVSRKMFRALWGKNIEQDTSSSNYSYTEETSLAFWDEDSITIIDDYERIYEDVTIYKLSDSKGSVIESKELNLLDKQMIEDKEYLLYNGELVTIVDKRNTHRYKIKHRQIAGDYILEETDFPSEQLPIIFVDQNSYYDKNGRQLTRSFFQDVKDAQRYLNYLATQSAYLLKVSRYDQYMVSKKNIASNDTEAAWRDPSTQLGAVPYDESPSGAKPEPLRPPELSASLLTQYERTLMDIQTGTGMYNAQLGEQGNEVSGAAIESRTKRGSYNTYVPFNRLNRAITTCGQIVNEMIPIVYDVERKLRLKMPERENELVTINQPMGEYGAIIKNDMTKGRFKIRIMPGPSYEGQQALAVESMQMILQANPQLFALIGDLFVENLPLPNHIELRNRIRTIVAPEIIEAGKTGKPLPPKPPEPNPEQQMLMLKEKELQMKMQQMQVDAQEQQAQLQLKQQELQRKALETHQDMGLQWEKIEAEKQEAAAQLQETLLRYEAELRNIQSRESIAEAQNLVKLLTHHTKKPEKEVTNHGR